MSGLFGYYYSYTILHQYCRLLSLLRDTYSTSIYPDISNIKRRETWKGEMPAAKDSGSGSGVTTRAKSKDKDELPPSNHVRGMSHP